ncbi:MAG: hypothetical protein QXP88_01350 [Thermoproteota archaeon]
MKVKEVEVFKTLNTIDRALSGVEVLKEPAWKTIRESRDTS